MKNTNDLPQETIEHVIDTINWIVDLTRLSTTLKLLADQETLPNPDIVRRFREITEQVSKTHLLPDQTERFATWAKQLTDLRDTKLEPFSDELPDLMVLPFGVRTTINSAVLECEKAAEILQLKLYAQLGLPALDRDKIIRILQSKLFARLLGTGVV